MSVIKLWAASLISNTKSYRQRPSSFQHLGVFCQRASWPSWVMLQSQDWEIADSQAGLRAGASRKERGNGLCCTGRARKETSQRRRNTFSCRNCWKNTPAESLFTCIRRWLWSSVDASLALVQQDLSVLLPGKELECITLCWLCFHFFPFLTCFLRADPGLFLQSRRKTKILDMEQSCAGSFTSSSSPTSQLLHDTRAMWRLPCSPVLFTTALPFTPGSCGKVVVHTTRSWKSSPVAGVVNAPLKYFYRWRILLK